MSRAMPVDVRVGFRVGVAALCCLNLGAAPAAFAANQPATAAFAPGKPLAVSGNAKTFGGFRFAESISYDPQRDLYVVPSAGMPQDVVANDGFVSLVNPDASVHTLKWIGVDRNGLTLNHPLGSHIANQLLYVADVDRVRWFDLRTGEPRGSVQVPGVTRFLNDIEVAKDGTVYATHTGDDDPNSWRVYKIAPDDKVTVLISGAPLSRPNGVTFDQRGNLVVVNIGSHDVLTFSPEGRLLGTEKSVDAGNDGIVVMPDGTKYVSSVRIGTVSRIRPGQAAELIASGIPSAASMTYDPKRNRLVIPMNDWNSITFLELNDTPR